VVPPLGGSGVSVIDRILQHAADAALAAEKPEPFYLSISEMIEFLNSREMKYSAFANLSPLRYFGVPILEKPPNVR